MPGTTDITRRESEALRLYWAHRVDKAQYAKRHYLTVEPENRSVARELEPRR